MMSRDRARDLLHAITSPRYGTRADKRKRKKRIAKKIRKRGGWLTHAHGGGYTFGDFLGASGDLGLAAAASMNQRALLRWDRANRDVIDDLVARGIPRAERKLILKGLRRLIPVVGVEISTAHINNRERAVSTDINRTRDPVTMFVAKNRPAR